MMEAEATTGATMSTPTTTTFGTKTATRGYCADTLAKYGWAKDYSSLAHSTYVKNNCAVHISWGHLDGDKPTDSMRVKTIRSCDADGDRIATAAPFAGYVTPYEVLQVVVAGNLQAEMNF